MCESKLTARLETRARAVAASPPGESATSYGPLHEGEGGSKIGQSMLFVINEQPPRSAREAGVARSSWRAGGSGSGPRLEAGGKFRLTHFFFHLPKE